MSTKHKFLGNILFATIKKNKHEEEEEEGEEDKSQKVKEIIWTSHNSVEAIKFLSLHNLHIESRNKINIILNYKFNCMREIIRVLSSLLTCLLIPWQ